jgi:rhamnose transport system permease protein
LTLRFGRETAGVLTLGAVFVYLTFAAPAFFTAENLRDVALTNVPVLLVATGMTFVIISAGIDISVGALFAVCSVICGLASQWLPIPFLPLVALMVGALLGATNGALISFVRAPAIVVTLATMVAWREGLRWATGGAWVQNLPPNFQWLGLGQSAGELLIVASALILFAAFWWASTNLMAVRAVYATGSDEEAARLAGIPTKQVTFWVFVTIGALTGVAAMLNAVRFAQVPANSGINLELKAIAAVVVGGTPITGGRGSLFGTFVGVVLLGSIGPALTFLGINPFWEKAIQGLIILMAVLLDSIGNWHQAKLALT